MEFSDSELAQTLTRLQAHNQSYCLGLYDTAHIRVGGALLVVDVGWPIGRRLIESYQLGADTTKPYGVEFRQGQATYTLNQALAGAGYVGQADTLAQVFMAIHNGGSQVYVAAGQLVQETGSFDNSPAQLKTLAAGANVLLTDEGGVLTITSTVDQIVGEQGAQGVAGEAGAVGPAGPGSELGTGNPEVEHVKVLQGNIVIALVPGNNISLTPVNLTHVEIAVNRQMLIDTVVANSGGFQSLTSGSLEVGSVVRAGELRQGGATLNSLLALRAGAFVVAAPLQKVLDGGGIMLKIDTEGDLAVHTLRATNLHATLIKAASGLGVVIATSSDNVALSTNDDGSVYFPKDVQCATKVTCDALKVTGTLEATGAECQELQVVNGLVAGSVQAT